MTRQKRITSYGLPRESRGSLCYWGLALIIAGLYAVLSALTPYSLDDWTFMGNYRDDAEGGYEFSIGAWWRYFQFIRGYDNGRIANSLAPISTMFSPWKELFPAFTGILMALIAVLLQKIACLNRHRQGNFEDTLLLTVTWVLMIIGLPWRDTIFVRDYTLNYIWASAITLSLLWLMRKWLGKERVAGPRMLILVLLAIVAGGWHEGFALPTICGLCLLIITRKFRLPVSFYIVLAVYTASTLLFMLSPGLINRAVTTVGNPEISHKISWRNCFIVLIDSLLLICVWLRSPQKTVEIKWPSLTVTVGIGIMISGYILAGITTNTARSYFWPDMAAVCIGVRMTGQFLGSFRRFRKAMMLAYAGVLTALCIAQTVCVIVWQDRYRRETEEIMALLEKSKTGVIYYEMKLPPRAPFYTLDIPVGNHIWREPWHPIALKSYLLTEEDIEIKHPR